MKRPQLKLSQLLLLSTVCGVWISNYKFNLEIERMNEELLGFEVHGRFLIIDDTQSLKVLEDRSVWAQELKWQVYVPPRGRFALNCSNDAREDLFKTIELDAGINQLTLTFDEPLLYSSGKEYSASVILELNGVEHHLSKERFTDPAQMTRITPRTSGVARTPDTAGRLDLTGSNGVSQAGDWKLWIQSASGK